MKWNAQPAKEKVGVDLVQPNVLGVKEKEWSNVPNVVELEKAKIGRQSQENFWAYNFMRLL